MYNILYIFQVEIFMLMNCRHCKRRRKVTVNGPQTKTKWINLCINISHLFRYMLQKKKNNLICDQINVFMFIHSLFNVKFYIVCGWKITDHLSFVNDGKFTHLNDLVMSKYNVHWFLVKNRSSPKQICSYNWI